MTFNKKILLIWMLFFGIGSIINLTLIPISSSFIFGWLLAGIGNVFFILANFSFLNFNFLKQFGSNFRFYSIIFHYLKMLINMFIQLILTFFLFYINFKIKGSWDMVYFEPINLFSFLVAIILPSIAFIIGAIIIKKREVL